MHKLSYYIQVISSKEMVLINNIVDETSASSP